MSRSAAGPDGHSGCARRQSAAEKKELSMAGLWEEQRLWLGKIRERYQQEGVEVEIFISAGSFCLEVLRFARAQSTLQFIILGFPGDARVKGLECEPPDLQSLRRQLEGEILLVPGQGKVVRLMDNSGQRQRREK